MGSSEKRSSLFNRKTACLVLGLAFLWLCLKATPLALAQINRSYPMSSPWEALAYYALYALVLFAVSYAMAVASKRPRFAHYRSALLVAAGLCGCIGLGCLTLSSSLQELLLPSLVLTSVFISVFLFAWGSHIVASDPKAIPFLISLSYALSELLRLASSYVADDGLRFLFPLASLAFLILSPLPDKTSSASERQSLRSISWKIVSASALLIILWSVVLGVFPQSAEGTLSSMDRVWSYGVSCLILTLMAAFFWSCLKRNLSKRMFLYPFTALVVTYMAVLACMLVIQTYEFIFFKRLFISIAQCLEVLTLILIAFSISERKLSHIAAFSIYTVFLTSGPWVIVSNIIQASNPFGDSHLGEPITVALSFITAIVLIVFLLRYATSSAKDSRQAALGDDYYKSLCDKAGAAGGLSNKEREVLALLYRGYSAKRIAEMLYVSENTVRSHTNNIYRKLSVHSKQELIALVDGYRE